MWSSRSDRDRTAVVCIACGDSLLRSDAREYDKEGDRWNRQGKRFEYVCKECYRGMSHQPRGGLEELLAAVEAPDQSREEFLRRYLGEAERRSEERGR